MSLGGTTYHRMMVYGITLDPLAQMPVVFLKDEGEENVASVWISTADAVIMATDLIGRNVAQEAGHRGLIALLLERLGMEVSTLRLDLSPSGGYGATVAFSTGDGELELPVHLTDILILAIRFGHPVMVAEEVVAKGRSAQAESDAISDQDASRFIDFLEKLDPGQMGKYPM